jgi:hypothetical protein
VCGENFDSIFAYKTHQKDKHGYLWCENDCKVAYPAKEKHECTASLQFVFKCPYSTCPIVKNAPEFLDHCAKQHMTSLGEKTMKDILTEGQYFVRSDQIDEYVQQLDKFPSLPVKTTETKPRTITAIVQMTTKRPAMTSWIARRMTDRTRMQRPLIGSKLLPMRPLCLWTYLTLVPRKN